MRNGKREQLTEFVVSPNNHDGECQQVQPVFEKNKSASFLDLGFEPKNTDSVDTRDYKQADCPALQGGDDRFHSGVCVHCGASEYKTGILSAFLEIFSSPVIAFALGLVFGAWFVTDSVISAFKAAGL